MADRICTHPECANTETERLRFKRGLCNKHYLQWHRNNKEPRMPRWQYNEQVGKEITYAGAHWRVALVRGAATDLSCVDCGSPAEHWSYRGGSPREQWGQNGKYLCPYSPDPDDYDPRCVPCHKVFDLGR